MTEDRNPTGRRAFLRGTGILATAAFGSGTGITAAAATPAGAPLPEETGWQPKPARLSTPWTSEVSPDNALPEYPRPQLRRDRWRSLNGVWQFGAAEGDQAAPIGRELPERILVPYPVESALSGIMRRVPRMFYRRRFTVAPGWSVHARTGNRLLLHFDAVDYRSVVWVNGKEIGTHEGGFDRFTLDVTEALHTDATGNPSGHQEIVVAVEDRTDEGIGPVGKQHNEPDGLFYTSCSGIWQTVWLEPVARTHIERLDLGSSPDNRTATVRARVTDPAGHRVHVALFEKGRRVGSVIGEATTELRITPDEPRPWSPRDPFLYDLTVRLVPEGAPARTDGRATDRVDSYLGIRSIAIRELDGYPRFLLNGEHVFPLSTLQQGYWPDGLYTPATDAALRFDLEAAKKLGFNSVRKHVKVEPDRWYYWADRLGMLVWQDMPSAATGRQPPKPEKPVPPPPAEGRTELLRELRTMIEDHQSHPSIIMWIPFNEGWAEFAVSQVADLVKRWDPSRPVNPMSGFNVCECGSVGGDILDRHNLGTPEAGPVPHPDDGRAAVIGEFGAFGLPITGHEWKPGHSEPNVAVQDPAALTDAYVTALGQIAEFAREQGLAAANYNLFEDAEVQVNGLYTYDRRILKPDPARVRAANLALTGPATS
ncbi:glycoside hydrolase family 2 protein [Sciscionella sediminilitoris]|uniref:glycoside hydrolase family 2 protein n=1 Tax=Sciscionella sediminilitoris TaxID=1445613 RepID=UPI00069096A2|nr:glycoside hydrolase family 2 [Sciscionella sp. SE31]